ncbi:NADH dehydrogenase [ubiquinone] 1 alpha subcomplex subunit 13-like protein [Dinothrombium tinctorium]|uniref:NADH dehydrogenase [ubiquinone] 1 alpha subcomplex subunit 13 n=1 Tax=Dinothrombium tinctorium TaxID=1965070 RepID=A0A443R2X9_9ACAR|nr:NADH dehydrogenase [ubiquinone] 1 alpha subcomplex subunit 13-like protein [Dinothrombium tinctorium]
MASVKQDMPPAGGYAPIIYQRVPHKRVIQNWMLVAGLIGTTAYGFYLVKKNQRFVKYASACIQLMHCLVFHSKLKVEKFESLVAVEPFLYAEKDRGFLKELKALREYERDLMKDHPYWEVGTLYGDHVYRSLPKDHFPIITISEYYSHRPFFDQWEYTWPDHWL